MIAKVYTNTLVFGNKPEDVEGYDDAINSSEIYVPHHVLEWKYTVDELEALNRYWQVDASELIWMTRQTHNGNTVLHKGHRLKNEAMKCKTLSEETRNKISEANTGRTSLRKGITLSEEHKKKISESLKGKHWFNNGLSNVAAFECPEGFVKGMLKRKK